MPRKKAKIDDNVEITIGKVVVSPHFTTPFWQQIHDIESRLSEKLKDIQYPKNIAAVYNPLIYASDLHSVYLSKFVDGPKSIIFIGMNPGPFGMCQTSVPFGNVSTVRDWMQISGRVNKPEKELPARPVEGLNCHREEQSGTRWWGLIKKLYGTPENFFQNCYIYNYCPLAFFEKGGKNITPAEIKGEPRNKLQEACTESLQEAINLLRPEIIVGIGKYAEDRVIDLKRTGSLNSCVKSILRIPHPSPRSINNTNWPEKAEIWFKENQIFPYLQH